MDGTAVHVVHHPGRGMSVSSGHRFRLTPPTSDAETRLRSTTCARLSRHAKRVGILLLRPENIIGGSIYQGVLRVVIFGLHKNNLRVGDSRLILVTQANEYHSRCLSPDLGLTFV